MTTLSSICVYCGSSTQALERHIALAHKLGEALAEAGVRLVYGGTNIGLMGACARASRARGGAVLGIIPEFLSAFEPPYEDCDLRMVTTMAERKQMMADEADAFIVLPGGIGTLEEAIETLSWRRLGLHSKPLAFLADDGFWEPLKPLFAGMERDRLLPPSVMAETLFVTTPKEALAALSAAAAAD